VHVVEAVFAATSGEHSCGHDSRIDRLKFPKFAEIFTAYRPLYAASLVARYLEDSSARRTDAKPGQSPPKSMRYSRFTDYMPANQVVQRLLKKRLDLVEQHASKFLSEASRTSLLRICHAQLP
jgi:hypothetical protein